MLRFCASVHGMNFNPLPSHEGRLGGGWGGCSYQIFQSTPLTRGETYSHITVEAAQAISIHSPHTRGDASHPACSATLTNFNPLPSHEGRRQGKQPMTDVSYFNPLPSHEGRRGLGENLQKQRDFNPLPSHEGRRGLGENLQKQRDFNPLPSHEGRLGGVFFLSPSVQISIHSPHTRGDNGAIQVTWTAIYFNPLPSHEGRPVHRINDSANKHFNPLPSHEGRPVLFRSGRG